MKILALTVALFFAASPVAAQQTQQALGTNGQINTSTLPNTGVICQEEMVATFCNVATGPNNAGYGTHGSGAATSPGITTPSKAIPACGATEGDPLRGASASAPLPPRTGWSPRSFIANLPREYSV